MLPICCNYIISPSLILTYTIRPTVSLLQIAYLQSPVSIIGIVHVRVCIIMGFCASVDACVGVNGCLRQCGCLC